MDDLKASGNIRKIATGCLLDCLYFKKYHTLIAIDLSKQQKLDADRKEKQQINFTGNLDRAEGTVRF